MDAVLYGLTVADNTTAYAADHGITVTNDSVPVLVTLQDNRTVPAEFTTTAVETDANNVQTRVAIAELTALATHRNVSYVRRPPAANTGRPTP